MYQYKAVLVSSKEVITEGHTLEEIEHALIAYRRQAKKGVHPHTNDQIKIVHVRRNKLWGRKSTEEIIKIV